MQLPDLTDKFIDPSKLTPQAVDLLKGLGFDLNNEIDNRSILLSLDYTLCELSFYYFVRRAWKHVYQEPYVDGWHIAALCYHLQALWEGQMKTFVYALSPGCGKSRVACCLYSAWLWAKNPAAGQWFSSFGKDLCERDSANTRILVNSDWYQRRWGNKVAIRDDENRKMMYRNVSGGWRLAASTHAKAGFGEHPQLILVDDGLHPKQAESPAEREHLRDYLQNTLGTRGIVTGVKMAYGGQRLHENDGHDYFLSSGKEVTYLCIPMEFEEERRCTTNITYLDFDAALQGDPSPMKTGWTDPRKEEGELMWPEGFGQEKVDDVKGKLRRAHAIAGQLQQRPTSPEGDMMLAEWFEHFYDDDQTSLPCVRAWDLASTTGSRSDSTAGVRGTFDGEYLYIDDCLIFKKKRVERDSEIKATCQSDAEVFRTYQARLEYEGGSGGKDGPEILCEEIRAFTPCYIDKPAGKPKPSDHSLKGWETLVHLLSRGRVKFKRGMRGYKELVECCLAAPFGRHDDPIDALAHVARVQYRPKNPGLRRNLLLLTDEDNEIIKAEQQKIADTRTDGKGVCPQCEGLGCAGCNYEGFTDRKSDLMSILDDARAMDEEAVLGVTW